MELLDNFYTFNGIFKIAGIVFSFLFIVFTIQIFVSINKVAKTVVTKRNWAFVTISLLLLFVSILLLVLAFSIL